MYAANLSWKPMKLMLMVLINKGLVQANLADPKQDRRRRVNYTLTQRGTELIAKLKALDQITDTELFGGL